MDSITRPHDFVFSYYLLRVFKNIFTLSCWTQGYLVFIKTYLNKKLAVAGLLNYATETPELYLSYIC